MLSLMISCLMWLRMLLYSILHLTVAFIYCWINIRSLGYNGLFMIATSSLAICVVLGWWDLYQVWLFGNCREYVIFFWSELGNESYFFLNLRLDFLNVILAFVILTASLIVSSFVYIDMFDDKDGINFILNLGFFIIFMLIVSSAGNLLFFYLGWEGIGLTSLFLVNFWSERVRSIKAAIKVFFINKIGDFFLLLLICSLLHVCGDLDFDVINALSPLFSNFYLKFFSIKFYLSDVLGLLLFFSGCVKSAQYGFHIWLLEAMEAPLGASALMHSSTLVVAGLILNFKLSTLIELSYTTQIIMFFFGVLSSFAGSLIAVFQYELKVIMAYSTISNMGYMFTLFSLGAYRETLIIMILHAYIKIYMFLIVGSIMLHCNGSQDLRWMGGLFSYIPTLAVSYFIASFSLMGLPFLSGYYYKSMIWYCVLENSTFLKSGETLIFFSFIFTIIYLVRVGYLVFSGSKNGHRSIYRKKSYPLLLTLNFFIVSLIVIFNYSFVNVIVYSNLSNSSLSYYNSLGLFFNLISVKYSEYSLFVWSFVYVFFLLIFFFWYIFSINLFLNFIRYWYWSILFFLIFFFYFFFNNFALDFLKFNLNKFDSGFEWTLVRHITHASRTRIILNKLFNYISEVAYRVRNVWDTYP